MSEFTKIVAPRLKAANERLMAKGWRCPSIEVGAKVLGEHGLVVWASAHLDGNHRLSLPSMLDNASMETVLDKLDEEVERAPTAKEKRAELEAALAKLTPAEKELMGLRRYEIERMLEELRQ